MLLCVAQVFIASACLLLLIPWVRIVSRTPLLHINCRCLLVLTMLAQVQMIGTHATMFGYQWIFDIAGEDAPAGSFLPSWQMPWAWSAASAIGLYTVFSLWLLLERFVAMRRPETYSTLTRPPVACGILCLIGYTALWTVFLIMNLELATQFEAALSLVVEALLEALVVFLSVASFLHVRKRFEELRGTQSLTARYQMFEVLAFNRAILPVILAASTAKLILFIPLFLFIFKIISYSTMQHIFFGAQSVSYVAIKWMLIWTHPGLRRSCGGSVAPVDMTYTNQQEPEKHFEILRKLWKE